MARTTVATQLAAIKKQQELLAKKEAALLTKSNSKVIAQIVKLAKDAGLTASDIAQALGSAKTAKLAKGEKAPKAVKKGAMAGKKVAPKYRNPSNHEQTWTGRGVAPKWVAALKAAGTLDSALIVHAAPAEH